MANFRLTNFIYFTLFAFILGVSLARPVLAGNPVINKTVLAGHTIDITGILAVDASCAPSEQGEIRIVQQPTHGTLALVQKDVFPNYAFNNPRHICNTTKTPSTVLQYTAAPDFNGTDLMSIEIFTPSGGDSNEVKVLITVK